MGGRLIDGVRDRLGRPRRLGSGLLLLGVLLMVGLAAGEAQAQLSPGKLSQAHAGLEGGANCLKCHAPREGVAAERCLDCHGALAVRIGAGQGLHARSDYQSCETCHIEHHGREFELIFWGEAGREVFDHGRTGWALTGAHRDTACRECHRPERLQDRAALQRGAANPRTTFLGLSTACADCHADEHRGQFDGRLDEGSCAACHTTTAFQPAPGFDHSTTDFPLATAHQKLACTACHRQQTDAKAAPGGDATFLEFAGIAHGSCADCHRDPHEGRFGSQCSTCHDPDHWSRVDRAGFDHDRTGFPLEGRHRSLACTACHREGGASAKRTSGACSDCHRDSHQGRLGSACASCHDPAGWKKVELGAFDHGRTRFPLEGSHRDVACAQCHSAGEPKRGLSFAACADCHGDPHLGQLRQAAGGGACSDCHTVESFLPATFTAEDHQRTEFPLEGAHRAVACNLCHLKTEPESISGAFPLISSRHAKPGRRSARPAAATRFRFTDTSCEVCHGDPHAGSTAAVGPCTSCHSLESWQGVSFDHEATGFPLEGGHEDLACAACHGSEPAGERKIGGQTGGGRGGGTRFAEAVAACAACHEDPHFGTPRAAAQVAAVDCASCHVTATWKRTSFEHRRDTGFALEGAHQLLQCAACHGRGLPEEPLPTTCEGCHGGAVMPGSSARR